MKMTMTFNADNYHLAHVQASAAKISRERLHELGSQIADCFYLGSQGPFPARQAKRKLKDVQLHALGAIALMFIRQPNVFDGLSIDADDSGMCFMGCPRAEPENVSSSPVSDLVQADSQAEAE
jgi:hypothetical protein